jgi:lipoprotein-anchoring transpeptidase ErfK/SrfK
MSMRTAIRGLALAIALVCLPALVGTAEARRGDGVEVQVSIGGQRMEVYVDGKLKHRWSVSTGRDGYGTPGGNYRPQRLEREWYSKKYDDAPMPYAIFYSGGYAIHGTNATSRLGRTASHGCVRLSTGNAATLFSLVEQHGAGSTRIVIN